MHLDPYQLLGGAAFENKGFICLMEQLPWERLQIAAGAVGAAQADWCCDLQCKAMDECVQLFGGYGYLWEYPITRTYADARMQRIYGGTNEIMKEVISRAMGLGAK